MSKTVEEMMAEAQAAADEAAAQAAAGIGNTSPPNGGNGNDQTGVGGDPNPSGGAQVLPPSVTDYDRQIAQLRQRQRGSIRDAAVIGRRITELEAQKADEERHARALEAAERAYHEALGAGTPTVEEAAAAAATPPAEPEPEEPTSPPVAPDPAPATPAPIARREPSPRVSLADAVTRGKKGKKKFSFRRMF